MTGLMTWFHQFNWMAVWPEILFLTAVVLLLLIDAWRPSWSRWAGYGGIIILLGLLFLIFEAYYGRGYEAFDKAVFFDNFSLTTLVMYLVAGLLIAIAVWPRYEDTPLQSRVSIALAVLIIAIFSLMVMTSTLHLVTLFIALELLSLSLYVLIALQSGSLSGLEAATKYFLLGAFASAFMLYGIVFIYGALGTVDLFRIKDILSSAESIPLTVHSALALIFVGVGFKASVVPFHLWTPEVYQGAPTELTGFMSVAVKTAALGVLYRILRLVPQDDSQIWLTLVAVLASFTMVAGNLNAIRQHEVKRLLAYSSIAHAGYIFVGFLGPDTMARESALFYLLVYTFMNVGAFLVVAVLEAKGIHADLEDHQGLVYRYPGWALMLTLLLLALAGVPPTGGFLAKLWVFRSALDGGWTAVVIFAVVNSVIGAYYYLRWVMVLYRPAEKEALKKKHARQDVAEAVQGHVGYVLAVLLCVFFTLQLGLWPDRLMQLIRLSLPGI